MLLTKLLVANLMIGITVVLQGVVPIGYLSKQNSFWMYIVSIIFLVLAVIAFTGLIFLGRSPCAMTMGQSRMGIYHSPTAFLSAISLVFFIVYAFVADVSINNAAIRNLVLLLITGTSSILLISLVVVLLAFRTNYEIAPSGSD